MPTTIWGNRHYHFAKYLTQAGYNVKVFAASSLHNSDENLISNKQMFLESEFEGLSYVYVRAGNYKGNGMSRIKNMLEFSGRLRSVFKKLARKEGRPDVLCVASPHNFVCMPSLRYSKKAKIPCIVEVADLWPESIVAYFPKFQKNPAIALMYSLEKWMYKRADRIIFTMEGGAEYICDKGWGKKIDLSKVKHINNGVNLELFDAQAKENIVQDSDLDDETTFKIIYAGSIRHANGLGSLLDIAKFIASKNQQIKFLIWGDGDQKESLEKRAVDEQIDNVTFKGRVEKKYIPYITSKAQLLLLHYDSVYERIFKYGGSQNKFFEYLASGRPILSDIEIGYSIISKYKAGVEVDSQNPEDIANAIDQVLKMPIEEIEQMGKNARAAAEDYDYKVLADKFIHVLEEMLNESKS